MKELKAWMDHKIDGASKKAAKMSSGNLGMNLLSVRLVGLHEVGGLLGGESASVVGVGMSLLCEPPMHFLMLMTPEARTAVVEAVTGAGSATDEELAASILQEMGNILGSTMANALAELFERVVQTSTPQVVADMAGALLSGIIAGLGDIGDEVLLTDVEMTACGNAVDSRIFLFFGDQLHQRLIPRVREVYSEAG